MMSQATSTPQNLSLQSEGINSAEMDSILRSIIITRCKDGATIDEIIGDYKEHTGECILSTFRNRDSLAEHLRVIQGVYSIFNGPTGPYLWFCNTPKTQHLSTMIKKQKSPRVTKKYQTPRYQPPQLSRGWRSTASVQPCGPRDKFFEDNYNYIPKRNGWNRIQQQRGVANHPYLPRDRRPTQQTKPIIPNVPNSTPLFCGCQMIGDDFFLSLARWELGFSFDPGHLVQQCGLCISGLTIAEAADRVMKVACLNDRVIVNIGAVDVLHGHDYVDMQQDLIRLINNLETLGIGVILTTISPLASSSHIPGMATRLQQYNDFIRSQKQYIDLWRCFVNERDMTLYECFQPGPRYVSGSNKPHVLWNKLGRQRVIKFLKTELALFI